MPRLTDSLRPCSKGRSMFRPTESPRPSRAPRLAASIVPGPPPVMMARPVRAGSAARARAASYIGSGGRTRAEPKKVTAGPSVASASKPATNSAWIRSTRQGSLSRNSGAPSGRSSSLRSSFSRTTPARPMPPVRRSPASSPIASLTLTARPLRDTGSGDQAGPAGRARGRAGGGAGSGGTDRRTAPDTLAAARIRLHLHGGGRRDRRPARPLAGPVGGGGELPAGRLLLRPSHADPDHQRRAGSGQPCHLLRHRRRGRLPRRPAAGGADPSPGPGPGASQRERGARAPQPRPGGRRPVGGAIGADGAAGPAAAAGRAGASRAS